ncbi:carbonic anhydrase family protein [Caballeronia sp. SEWSISQ10-4 2]|uniref:carbonic anhydrase n=1 Tax=Caballeronia sp. SEWSISQ10-4 2 TaxID=2937438 RepID=UPI00264E6D63|nr:carbonic anhydrase family protein [Caballeronia sp. SEWSISQ10-4 2]MDN7180407.1 carbonic anhydrase family protein [Caballeronia sp. SEWSISQ10-4 2]
MNKIKRLSSGAFLLTAFVALTASAESNHDWTYNGEHGPEHWAEISKDFHACEDGRAESPINIEGAKKAPADMPRLKITYQPLPIDIANTGHSIQFNAAPGTDSITLGGRVYQLVQFHFHAPGEERFAGKESVMDAHLVHHSDDDKLLVLAVQFKIGDQPNSVIQTMLDRIPHEKGAEFKVKAVMVNPLDLLPKDTGYYTYSDSLTTPPCSEGVTWIEFKEPVIITQQQPDAMQRFYHGNQRPVQALNGRDIWEVN